MADIPLREKIVAVILRRFSPPETDRLDAVADVLLLGMANLNKAKALEIAAEVPELPFALYEKWAGMFADRLLETVPEEQIRVLCGGSPENEASLALVFVMFMESERMEKTVSHDLRALPTDAATEDRFAGLSLWLKGRASATVQ